MLDYFDRPRKPYPAEWLPSFSKTDDRTLHNDEDIEQATSATAESQTPAAAKTDWQPTISIAFGPNTEPDPGDPSTYDAVTCTFYWSVENQPDLDLYNPIYGPGHQFYLVIDVDGTEIWSSGVFAGNLDSFEHDLDMVAGVGITATATLYSDNSMGTVVVTQAYTYTPPSPP